MLEKAVVGKFQGVIAISKKTKLNYRFHNPNTPEVTADYILKILIEVNLKKIDRILEEKASQYISSKNGEGEPL